MLETKHTARMRDGLRALLDGRRKAEAEAAEAMAQLDDDETRDAEEIERTKEAWLTAGSFIRVEVDEDCDFDAGKGDGWPVTCTKLDATDRALCALKRQPDFGKVMRAARQALRTLKLRRSFTPEDMGAPWGASAIAVAVGYKDDGTIEGMVWFQKRLRLLQDLGWNYGGSTEMHCGLDRTLKAQKCLVHVVAHVEGKDSDRGESSAFEAMLIATGFRHACQCPMRGVGETGLQVWAPGPLKTVLADPQHDLHEYARKGIAPPLTPPQSREEMSASVKEGKKNMSAAAKKREDAGRKKGGDKSGCGLPGKENLQHSTKPSVLARLRGFSCLVHLAEARECIQLNRKPAPWAEGFLKPKLLKSVAKAGLAKDEFWTVLPEEKEEGVQGFDIEGFRFTKEEGHIGGPHLWDWVVDTQRGPFPVWDVADALGLVSEGKPAPKPRWWMQQAPRAVKELIDRALAWTPPASEPSPPPAKKPRSAPPRRSGRLNK